MNLFGNEAISQGKVKLEQAGTPSGVAGVLPHQMAWEDTCTENSVKIRAETGDDSADQDHQSRQATGSWEKDTHTYMCTCHVYVSCIRDINICLFTYIYIYIYIYTYTYTYIYIGSFLVA